MRAAAIIGRPAAQAATTAAAPPPPPPCMVARRSLVMPSRRSSRSSGRVIVAAGGSTATAAAAPKLDANEARSLQALLSAWGDDGALPPSPAGGAAVRRLSAEAARRVDALLRDGLARRVDDLARLEGAVLLAEADAAAAAAADVCVDDAAAAVRAVRVWQPVFASAGGFPRLLYIPVPEYFVIGGNKGGDDGGDDDDDDDDGGKTLDVVTELGPLVTHFLGRCEWLPPGKAAGEEAGEAAAAVPRLRYVISSVRVDLKAADGGGGRANKGRTLLTIPLPGPLQLKNELALFLFRGRQQTQQQGGEEDAAAAAAYGCARSSLGGTMLMAADPAAGQRYVGAP